MFNVTFNLGGTVKFQHSCGDVNTADSAAPALTESQRELIYDASIRCHLNNVTFVAWL
jgi:hypothetical protein